MTSRVTASSSSSSPPLLDSFGRRVTYLRVSVTERCNFRCVYCMPAEGNSFCGSREPLSFDEIERVVALFGRRGVRRVRLTGGEPLLRPGLAGLVARLKALAGIEEVVLTTNAFLLPQQAGALRDAGLDGLNISLDALKAESFAALTRTGDLSRVLEGIGAAREAGWTRLKFNAVIVRGVNDDELVDLVRFGAEQGGVMRFIEFMPIGPGTLWAAHRQQAHACVTAAEMRQRLGRCFELEPEPRARERGSGPARYWRLRGAGLGDEGALVGIISAVSECFCGDCNRLRLTAQGGLRACLADDREADLRAVLRSDLAPEEQQAVLEAQIARALASKEERHRFALDGDAVTRKKMHAIGG